MMMTQKTTSVPYEQISTYYSYKNFFDMSFYSNRKLDLTAITYSFGIIALEGLDTYAIFRPLALGGGNPRGLVYLGAWLLIQPLKEILYSKLITEHLTQNSGAHIIEMIKKTESLDSTNQELISNALTQSDAVTYQFGNIARGVISSSTKFFGFYKAVSKDNFVFPVAYMAINFYWQYQVIDNLEDHFDKVKTTAADIRNMPFKYSDSLALAKEIEQKYQLLYNQEQNFTYTKAKVSLLNSFHEAFANRDGYQRSLSIFSQERDRDVEQKNFKDFSYSITWIASNNMRVIDINYRMKMLYKCTQELKGEPVKTLEDDSGMVQLISSSSENIYNSISSVCETIGNSVSTAHKFLLGLVGNQDL